MYEKNDQEPQKCKRKKTTLQINTGETADESRGPPL